MPVSFEARPAPAKAMPVSIPHEHERAKAMAVSDKWAIWPTGPRRDTRGRRGLAKQQANAPSNVSDLASLVWRAPEGPEGQAAVPAGSRA